MSFLYVIKKKTPRIFKQIYTREMCFIKTYGIFLYRFINGRYKQRNKPQKPTTIQLPITYKCNFDCVMCGMHNLIHKQGFSAEELQGILHDDLFTEIESVGINGGEPFLLPDLIQYVSCIIESLPKLKRIDIISNGYLTEKILSDAKTIKNICTKRNVKLSLSISLDGINEMQDRMRGKVGAFKRCRDTIERIKTNKDEYCDSFKTLCTITKINVYNLCELDSWAKRNEIPIRYNIATLHKRICNNEKYESFSILTDKQARMMATEFLYYKFKETRNEKYYGLYYYALTGDRIAMCSHRSSVVTLTPDGCLAYCATYSDEIGDTSKCSANEIFFSKENVDYRKKLCEEYCHHCSQYSGNLRADSYLSIFAKDLIKDTVIYR